MKNYIWMNPNAKILNMKDSVPKGVNNFAVISDKLRDRLSNRSPENNFYKVKVDDKLFNELRNNLEIDKKILNIWKNKYIASITPPEYEEEPYNPGKDGKDIERGWYNQDMEDYYSGIKDESLLFEDVNPEDVFKTDTTSFSFYDVFLNDKSLGNVTQKEYYKFEKGIEGKIVQMTADEYINTCSKDVFGKSAEDIISQRSQKDIQQYAQDMLNGDKFPMPYISLSERNGKAQEGLHRAAAFKKAFGPNAKFNVLLVTDSNPTEEEIRDYAEKKWGKDNIDWGVRYVKLSLGLEEDRDSKETSESESKYIDTETYDAISLDTDYLFRNPDNKNQILRVLSTEDDGEFIEIYAEDVETKEETWFYLEWNQPVIFVEKV